MTSARVRLAAVEHQTVDAIAGPLLAAEPLTGVGYAERVDIIGPEGETRRGRVFEIDGDRVTVQVLDGTHGLDLAGTLVRSRGRACQLAVGPDLLGRAFNGAGQPIDRGPPVIPHRVPDIYRRALTP